MPVVNFAAGGVATPADAALMMQLGVDGVFVGSVSLNPVTCQTCCCDRQVSHPLQRSLYPGRSEPKPGRTMVGRNVSTMPEVERIAGRGW